MGFRSDETKREIAHDEEKLRWLRREADSLKQKLEAKEQEVRDRERAVEEGKRKVEELAREERHEAERHCALGPPTQSACTPRRTREAEGCAAGTPFNGSPI